MRMAVLVVLAQLAVLYVYSERPQCVDARHAIVQGGVTYHLYGCKRVGWLEVFGG